MDTSASERLKAARGGVSRESFARFLGVSVNTLGRYERGESTPTMAMLASICTEFGISPRWLLVGEGPKHEGGEDAPGRSTAASVCPGCAALQDDLREERRTSRELVAENRQLWREFGELQGRIGELKVENVKLEGELNTTRIMAKQHHERLKAREGPVDSPEAAPRKAG